MDRKTYKRFADAHAPHSPLLKNCFNAFWTGGLICVLGQVLRNVYEQVAHMPEEDAGTLTSVTLIFVAVVLSGVGIFDRIAKVAGAGTLVPITGFANSVVAPAIEYRAEGHVFGIGCKIFTIAGPVILFGIFSSWLLGLISWAGGAMGF